MSKPGSFMYKCRRCGKVYRDCLAPNAHGLLLYVVYGVKMKTVDTDEAPGMVSMHECSNGGSGVTDLIGVEED